MKYLQAMAVAVFAAALLMAAAGCEEQKTPPAANQVSEAQMAQMQKDLDQAKQDLKKVQDEFEAKLAAKTAEAQNLQKQLDAANAKLADIAKTVQDAMKVAAPMTPATPPSQ